MGIQLRADEIFAMSDRWVLHTYSRLKLAFVRGDGARRFDAEGRAVQLRADASFAMTDRWLMPTYSRIKLAFVRGDGSRLFDAEGRSFLDFVSGLAVTSLGHGHPKLKQAIVEAAESLLHTSNYF